MGEGIAIARLLLPEAAAFGAQRLAATAARNLGRASLHLGDDPGRRAQLRRHFRVHGNGWPVAALARQALRGDAGGDAWLRADPAWLRADLNGVRLMAHGPALGLGEDDVSALLPALRPLFGDAGFTLDAPLPSQWFLRLPPATALPAFPDPGDALGGDLFEHGEAAATDAAVARKWRALASEVQVVMHNHPWNARRAARGQAPVNALWFWGGGRLPVPAAGDSLVHGSAHVVHGDDDALLAFARHRADCKALPAALPAPEPGDVLFDLADLRDLAAFERDWLGPAFAQLRDGRLDHLTLDLADGRRFDATRWPLRLAFWRRAAQLDA